MRRNLKRTEGTIYKVDITVSVRLPVGFPQDVNGNLKKTYKQTYGNNITDPEILFIQVVKF